MPRRFFQFACVMAVAAALSACAADQKFASDADVAAATYVAGPPASITLITSINGRSNAGAHSALVINGSQRVLYDPAGSWELSGGLAPERRKDLARLGGRATAKAGSILRWPPSAVW